VKQPLIVLWTALLLSSQEAQQPIRSSVTLVQVDAIVTDSKGRPVSDLTKADFELYENGELRKLSGVSFVRTEKRSGSAAPAPAVRHSSTALQQQDITRTVAVVVDDLKMSIESLHFTREALRKFVDQQIGPGDLVAILTTSGQGGSYGFTTDRRALRSATDHLRIYLRGANYAGAVQTIGAVGESDDGTIAGLERRRFAVGTLGGIRHVVAGMRNLPGRKSVVLFSEGASYVRRTQREPPVTLAELQDVSGQANSSAVVIYAVDARGLVYPGLQAKDDVSDLESVNVREELDSRRSKFRDEQSMLGYLARATGGVAFLDNNDLNAGLRQALEDQSGYYLLEFHPDSAETERIRREGKYRRLTLKLRRPGLRVRYRQGFFGG